jgi:protein disulfide-isomerase A1
MRSSSWDLSVCRCGHCKELAPVYKKLGRRFRKIESVVIAKIDGTENEHKLLKVEGYPTILLFPAGEDKTPIPFEGGSRDLKVRPTVCLSVCLSLE